MNDTDNWVNTAINNNELVVNLLIKLRQSSSPSPVPLQKNWTVRQRRSLPPKKSPETRASPTTPLSYSGGTTSVSGGGGGGGEESSHGIHDGSKVIGPNETPPTKRPRKKKTLAELKEDEATLIKERKQLKRHLATVQAACQKQRTENESLKMMKIDLRSQHQGLTASNHNACSQGTEENGFVLPDLNIPAGEEY